MDLACLTFGRYVDNTLAERDQKGRPLHRLEVLLAEPGETPAVSGKGFGDWRNLAGMQGVTTRSG